VNEPVWLLESAVLIAHEISISVHGGGTGIRDYGLLQSALTKPKNLFEYGEPDLCELAAAYISGVVRNHPFVDGYKRAGFLAGAAFLEINGHRLIATETDATQMILGLAAGQISDENLSVWLRKNTEMV
jgi:death-on-curing protein